MDDLVIGGSGRDPLVINEGFSLSEVLAYIVFAFISGGFVVACLWAHYAWHYGFCCW